jgi:type II secretory pathway pseudopilin PulG
MKPVYARASAAFTLLEVMIAVAFIGIALVALLALHHTDLQSVIRGQDLTTAAMLAQSLMSQAELETGTGHFPEPGQKRGNFNSIYPGQYPNFSWQRQVDQSPLFPTVERVRIRVTYAGGSRHFDLTEFMHYPTLPASTSTLPPNGQNGNPTPPGQPSNDTEPGNQ